MKHESGETGSTAASRRKRWRGNFKRRGELAEMAFMHKAASLGFTVTKPYGESEAYDFIVDSGKRLWRVQVKSGSSRKREGYRVAVRHCWRGKRSGRSYTA